MSEEMMLDEAINKKMEKLDEKIELMDEKIDAPFENEKPVLDLGSILTEKKEPILPEQDEKPEECHPCRYKVGTTIAVSMCEKLNEFDLDCKKLYDDFMKSDNMKESASEIINIMLKSDKLTENTAHDLRKLRELMKLD